MLGPLLWECLPEEKGNCLLAERRRGHLLWGANTKLIPREVLSKRTTACAEKNGKSKVKKNFRLTVLGMELQQWKSLYLEVEIWFQWKCFWKQGHDRNGLSIEIKGKVTFAVIRTLCFQEKPTEPWDLLKKTHFPNFFKFFFKIQAFCWKARKGENA